MKTLRTLSYAALGVAFTHLVFGAIVRISGSGMGCGDHWPKCYDHWFPPMNRPDLVIEWSHRLLASILIFTIAGLAVAAWRKRAVAGVAGRGGVLRPVLAAVAIVLVTAGFGAVTVKLGNPAWATAVHWTLAMTLIAVLAAAGVRAGALGGASARAQRGTRKTARAATAAAAIAFLAVVLGGLTAKVPFAAVACQAFPLCGPNPAAIGGAVHVQLTHRTLAFLLVLHLFGVLMALRKRNEAPVVVLAARAAFALALTQIGVAAAMVLLHLPPVLRSMHEAVGVSVWIATFTFAYLSRFTSRFAPESEPAAEERNPHAPAGFRVPKSGHVSARAHASASADPAVESGHLAHTSTFAAVPKLRERKRAAAAPEGRCVSGEVELIDEDEIAARAKAHRAADVLAAEAVTIEMSDLVDAHTELDLVRAALAEATEAPAPAAEAHDDDASIVAEAALVAAAIEAADDRATTLDDLIAAADAASAADAREIAEREHDDEAAFGEAIEAVELGLGTRDSGLEARESGEAKGLTAEGPQPTALAEPTAQGPQPTALAEPTAQGPQPTAADPSAEAADAASIAPPDDALKRPPHSVAVIVARGADL